MDKKHYVFMNRSTSYGGVDIRRLDWLRFVDYSMIDVTVVNQVNIVKVQYEKSLLPLNVKILDAKDFEYSPRNIILWIKRFMHWSPHAVVYNQNDFFCFHFFLIALGAIFTRGNIFVSEHLAAPELPQKINRRKHWKIFPGIGLWKHKLSIRGCLARKILAVSHTVRERLVDWGYPEKKIRVIRHGIDTDLFRPSEEGRHIFRESRGIPDDAIVIVSTARLARVKRLDRLMSAFNALCQEREDLWLIIVGDGPDRLKLEENALCKKRVLFLGLMEREMVADILKGCDIFVLPSENEGFSNALLEAMSAGLLCVCTAVSGTKDIIKDGENGFIAENTDDGVYVSLRNILSLSSEMKKKIVANARTTIIETYTLKDAVREVLDILEIPMKHG